jgi:hypothetical protein
MDVKVPVADWNTISYWLDNIFRPVAQYILLDLAQSAFAHWPTLTGPSLDDMIKTMETFLDLARLPNPPAPTVRSLSDFAKILHGFWNYERYGGTDERKSRVQDVGESLIIGKKGGRSEKQRIREGGVALSNNMIREEVGNLMNGLYNAFVFHQPVCDLLARYYRHT